MRPVCRDVVAPWGTTFWLARHVACAHSCVAKWQNQTCREFAYTCIVRCVASFVRRSQHGRDHVVMAVLNSKALFCYPIECLYSVVDLKESDRSHSIKKYLLGGNFWFQCMVNSVHFCNRGNCIGFDHLLYNGINFGRIALEKALSQNGTIKLVQILQIGKCCRLVFQIGMVQVALVLDQLSAMMRCWLDNGSFAMHMGICFPKVRIFYLTICQKMSQTNLHNQGNGNCCTSINSSCAMKNNILRLLILKCCK